MIHSLDLKDIFLTAGPQVQADTISLESTPPQARTAKPVCPSAIYLCTEHPLVVHAVTVALACDARLLPLLKPTLTVPSSLVSPTVAILDIYSLAGWKHLIRKWITLGGRPIVLSSGHHMDHHEELGLINTGACGILQISRNFANDLPLAVYSVAEGRPWVRPDIMREFLQHANFGLSRVPRPSRSLTGREEQIVTFLIRDFSNRQIASLLSISERTVKFHVTNILRKLRMANRRSLVKAVDHDNNKISIYS